MILSTAPKRWELYKLLGEPVRLRLLALTTEEELTIGELAELLGEGQPNVSRHVSALKRSGLLSVRTQGTRALVRVADAVSGDPVVKDALAAGRALVDADGSLHRVAELVRARDAAAREFFDHPAGASSTALPTELPAYLTALAALVPRRALAVDAGTGEGALLDALAPVFDTVIAVDRSDAQLARARARLDARGYDNVELRRAEYDDAALAEDVASRGGADAVFASRVLHHAPRPAHALAALARLVKPGGALVVLDYVAHEDERLRDQQADQWLGFEPDEVVRLAEAVGLEGARAVIVPSSRCGDGPDGHLDWLVLAAHRPDVRA
jgi:ArsR family transcriptional regulator